MIRLLQETCVAQSLAHSESSVSHLLAYADADHDNDTRHRLVISVRGEGGLAQRRHSIQLC